MSRKVSRRLPGPSGPKSEKTVRQWEATHIPKSPSPELLWMQGTFTGNLVNIWGFWWISSKTQGPGEEGAAGYCPKILLLERAKMVLCPFHRSHREICTRTRPSSETKFLDDFWGPLSLPAPLFYCWVNVAVWDRRTSRNFAWRRAHVSGPPPPGTCLYFGLFESHLGREAWEV